MAALRFGYGDSASSTDSRRPVPRASATFSRRLVSAQVTSKHRGRPCLRSQTGASLQLSPVTPICIFSALIDGLTDQERYTLEVRNGELHIQPAPLRREANARVVPTARAA